MSAKQDLWLEIITLRDAKDEHGDDDDEDDDDAAAMNLSIVKSGFATIHTENFETRIHMIQ